MQEIEEGERQGFKNFLFKHSRVIIIVILLVLLAVPLAETLFVLGLKGWFSYFTGKLTSTTGVNAYLAKAIVLACMIPLLWSFRWVFSFQSHRRNIGYTVVACYILVFFVSMFFMTKDQKFDFATGKATKFYANTPEGIRYFDAPGFDPKYGIKLAPVDPTMSKSEALRNNPPKMIEGIPNFFDYVTGEPRVWYYETSDGSVEIFDQAGYHPKYGTELKPIVPEVIVKYLKQISANPSEGDKQDQKFDVSTGKAKKYYAKTPEGTRYFDNDGFDPKYGIKLQPVDPNVIRSEAMHNRPLRKIESPTEFFDPATNDPKVWYYEADDGFEFFDQPGYHPKYGSELKPVTPEVVRKYDMQLEKARKQKTEAEQKRIADEERKSRAAQTPPSNIYIPKQDIPQTRGTAEQVTQELRGRSSQMNNMRSFILDYFRANENKEMNKVLSFYGDTIDYYNKGVVLKSYIIKDKEMYFNAWHKLSYMLTDDLEITNVGNSETVTLTFTFSYVMETAKKTINGTTKNTWVIEKAKTSPRIISEKQIVNSRREAYKS